MKGLKDTTRDLASFFSNIKHDIDSFRFVFTKYLTREEEGKAFTTEQVNKIKDELKTEIGGTVDALNDQEKSDKNIVTMFEKMGKIIKPAKFHASMQMIDPFDTKGRDDVLDYFGKGKAIETPKESFKMQITQ